MICRYIYSFPHKEYDMNEAYIYWKRRVWYLKMHKSVGSSLMSGLTHFLYLNFIVLLQELCLLIRGEKL